MHTKVSASQKAVLLIGSGRLAKHLIHWNSLLEKPNILIKWNRSQKLELLDEGLNKSSLIWLTISDSAIEDFYNKHLFNSHLPVVHFSGALSNPHLLNAHPLMSFPHALLPDNVYKRIHFVISGFENLNTALPGFNNSFTTLNAKDKAFYHALCVLAGNFPQILWNEVAQQMQKLGLPSTALDHYIRQITENYLNLKDQAITGPLIRKDYITIEKNILSLSKKPNLKNIYTTFAKEFSL